MVRNKHVINMRRDCPSSKKLPKNTTLLLLIAENLSNKWQQLVIVAINWSVISDSRSKSHSKVHFNDDFSDNE